MSRGLKSVFCLHHWDGCQCTKCKTTRNVEHRWEDCEVCSRCGATRFNVHTWKADTCSTCGKHRLSSEACEALVDEMWTAMAESLGELPLDPVQCKRFLADHVRAGGRPDQIAVDFMKALEAHPEGFVDKALMIDKAVEHIWKQMREQLASLPIDAAACRSKLRQELTAGKSAQAAVDALVMDMNKRPGWYLSVPRYYSSGGYSRESTDKGAIGHDRLNVRTLAARAWADRVSTAFGTRGEFDPEDTPEAIGDRRAVG